MTHEIKDNIYYLYDVDGKQVLKIQLYEDISSNQIVIETNKEVYAGPVELLNIAN